jgi:epoxyqueuosine reductase
VGDYLGAYRTLIADEAYGDMGYLARHLPFKEDPSLLLPGVQSAIVVIKNYKNTPEKEWSGSKKVARYAAGLDYHEVMSSRLDQLGREIQLRVPDAQFYVGVDSRPLPERTLAIHAGIGFKGRNSMVIRPKLGSYFLIGVLLTTLDLPPDDRLPGGCGTCRLCVDACPTQAIGMDGSFTTTACISYQTIEHKTPLDTDTLGSFQGWIFGCDICQEVCPFNHRQVPLTDWPEFQPESGIGHTLATTEIPKTSALYRSRKRVLSNALNTVY